jgi:hypothetical protein
MMGGISYEKFDVVFVMIHKRNWWQRQQESFRRTKGKVWSRAQSGQKVMCYSCSEVRSMSPKIESLNIALWSNITIHTSLDMQATLRHLGSYHATTGGPRCPDTLESMSKPATFAIGLSCNTVDLWRASPHGDSRRSMGCHQC